ncbi:MAG: sugar ABC transporter permease [Anaerolineae bacterium]|nr:sugar ABC transporter permease [Anaerolineales bacterium]MCQ3976743.1 sugar ABC transporter permease [Anaerolineae bacterium]
MRRYLARFEPHYLVLLAPLLLFVLAISIYPLAFSFFISFFKYRLTDPNQVKTFLWFGNYLNAVQDKQVLGALNTTLIFVAGTVISEIVVGLGLALLLSAETRLMQIVRSFLLLPMAIPPLVVGLVWKSLYNVDFGVIPYYLKQMGLNMGRGPLGEISWAMPAVILVDLWQWSPLLMVIFLAGLKSLPREPYEAALVDGASRWQSFWYITLPLLKPTLLVGLLLRTMQSFKVFDVIYATTGGGPGSTTTVLNFHIFTVGMTFFDMGYAAALANILLAVVAILSIFYIRVLERQRL